MIVTDDGSERIYVIKYVYYPYLVLTLGLSKYIPLFVSKWIVFSEIVFVFGDRNHFGRAFVAVLCSRLFQINNWQYVTLILNYLCFLGLLVIIQNYPNIHCIYVPLWIVYELNKGTSWKQQLWTHLNVCAIFGTILRVVLVFFLYNYFESQVPNWMMLGYYLIVLSLNRSDTSTFFEQIPVWTETIIMVMFLVKLVYQLILIVLFLIH